MCLVSDKIKFCTCATYDVEKLKHYWKLYRYNTDKNNFIIGITVLPDLLIDIHYDINHSTILARLNESDAFDIPLQFNAKDVLEVVINNLDKNDFRAATYYFKFKKGKWKQSFSNYFEISNYYDEEQSGKIKSALKRKI